VPSTPRTCQDVRATSRSVTDPSVASGVFCSSFSYRKQGKWTRPGFRLINKKPPTESDPVKRRRTPKPLLVPVTSGVRDRLALLGEGVFWLLAIRRETRSRWAFRQRPRLVVVVVLVPTAVQPPVMVLSRFPALPVTGMVTIFIIAGGHPIGPGIWWTRPETRTPGEPRTHRVIVARNPRVLRTRTRRCVHDHRRRRWWVIVRRPEADPDPGLLAETSASSIMTRKSILPKSRSRPYRVSVMAEIKRV
jgi:hypothetical protein